MILPLTTLNASLLLVCNFLVLHAGIIKQLLSLVFSCMQTATPAKSAFAMNWAAQVRFIAASELPLSELLWLPTNSTGIFMLSKAKLKAADV